MAWNNSKEITMEIDPAFDHILEEGANTSINLRKISWNNRPYKVDIRKWSYKDGQEQAMKGVGLSDEGANELASVLIEEGYGDTKRIINAIKNRKDYNDAFNINDENIIDEDTSEEYYDASELFGGKIDG